MSTSVNFTLVAPKNSGSLITSALPHFNRTSNGTSTPLGNEIPTPLEFIVAYIPTVELTFAISSSVFPHSNNTPLKSS